MQAYTFAVKWVPGKLHLIADALSRAPHFSPHSEELTVETTFAVLADEHPQCNQLHECLITCICPAYKDLIAQIQNNFSSPSISSFAKSYKAVSDRLSIYTYNTKEFVLLDCRQIVPPPGAISFLLKNLHSAHVGTERTVRLTKQLFFWHGMLNDITTTIDSCKACQTYTPSQKKKTIQSQPLSKAAFSFQECASDLFTYSGNEYIVLVNRLKGFLCCDKLSKTTTSAILIKLTNWFNILGWPDKIRTDGGPQFRSGFDDFCKSFYIHHELSSPYHPESNGLAEAAVKNAKNLLKKCNMTGQNFQRSLSVLRNMPRSDGPSPVQLLFRLPQKTNILLPPWPMPSVDPASALSARAQHMKQHTAAANKRAFSYDQLIIGSKVHVHNAITKLWDQQAIVLAIRDNGESYVVRLDNGKQCIQGRILLRPIRTTAAPKQSTSVTPVPQTHSTRSAAPAVNTIRRSARLLQQRINR